MRHKNEVPSEHPLRVEPAEEDLAVLFTQTYHKHGAAISYCINEEQIAERLIALRASADNPLMGCSNKNVVSFLQSLGIADAEVAQPGQQYRMGVMLCESLLADNGSVVLSDRLGFGTAFPRLPQTTILVAFTSQVVADWEEAVARLKASDKEMPRNLTKITPSSADRQHDLHLILIEDQ